MDSSFLYSFFQTGKKEKLANIELDFAKIAVQIRGK